MNEATIHHYQRLLEALGGSGIGWYFTGVILEDEGCKSKCVCGHPVRYLFELKNDDKKSAVYVGSVCVETAPNLDPKLIEGCVMALKEFRRKQKELIADEKISKLNQEFMSIQNKIFEIRAEARRQGLRLGYSVYSYRPKSIDNIKLKTKKGIEKRLAGFIEYASYTLEQNRIDPPQAWR